MNNELDFRTYYESGSPKVRFVLLFINGIRFKPISSQVYSKSKAKIMSLKTLIFSFAPIQYSQVEVKGLQAPALSCFSTV